MHHVIDMENYIAIKWLTATALWRTSYNVILFVCLISFIVGAAISLLNPCPAHLEVFGLG